MKNKFAVSSLGLSVILGRIQRFVVKHIYADHNKSRAVKRILSRLLAQYEEGVMLNIGSGITRIHPKILNLEVNSGHNVDIVASADNIPLQHSSVDLVVSQEVLEHVPSPSDVLLEIYRVLKPGGCLYLQIPWVFGYHGCPNDYWRFSRDGIVQLVEDSGFCIQNLSITVGPFTGFYRVAVEAFAILGSLFLPSAYKAFKLFSAIIFSPVKLLDSFSLKSSQAHRLAGGFCVVAIKKN